MARSARIIHRCAIALALAVCAWVHAAPAVEEPSVQTLAREFPAGTIDTLERIARALDLAGRVGDRISRESEAERRRCEHVFFVNSCMNAVRHQQRAGEQEVQRVTLEAHDYRRMLDARARDRSRADALRQRALEDLERPRREAEAMQGAQARLRGAQEREEDAARVAQQAGRNPANGIAGREQERATQQALDEETRPGREASAERAFEQKSLEASDYAKTRIRDREVNAKRREDREAAREQKDSETPK